MKEKVKKPFYKRWWFIILAIIIVIAAIKGVIGGGKSGDDGDQGNKSPQKTVEKEVKPEIEVTAAQLSDDIKENALNAAKKYKGKVVSVTGNVSNIDSSGDYFNLSGGEFDFTNVMIMIDKKHQDQVSQFAKDQEVTVIGKVDDVGEVLGYTIKAMEIK